MTQETSVALFLQNAAKAGLPVTEVASMQEAVAYATKLCQEKEHFQSLLPAGTYGTSVQATLDAAGEEKIIAGPGLADADFAALEKNGKEHGFIVVKDQLRNLVAGLDVAISVAAGGIAETVTCILDCTSEEVRLASMLCEDHIIVVPKSGIVASSYEAEAKIEALQKDGPRFISLISGPSRTADIERVLALGVHGPLELHLLILDA